MTSALSEMPFVTKHSEKPSICIPFGLAARANNRGYTSAWQELRRGSISTIATDSFFQSNRKAFCTETKSSNGNKRGFLNSGHGGVHRRIHDDDDGSRVPCGDDDDGAIRKQDLCGDVDVPFRCDEDDDGNQCGDGEHSEDDMKDCYPWFFERSICLM